MFGIKYIHKYKKGIYKFLQRVWPFLYPYCLYNIPVKDLFSSLIKLLSDTRVEFANICIPLSYHISFFYIIHAVAFSRFQQIIQERSQTENLEKTELLT